jgi:hypothetical protein
MTDVVVLAGGTVEDEGLRAEAGVNCKSLIPLGRGVLVEYVVEAFREAGGVGRIALVGPVELRDHRVASQVEAVVKEGSSRAENLFLGMEALPGGERAVMATADTPLVTSEMVEELLTQAPDCDVCYPFVPRDVVLREFPERGWVFVRVREGEFTGSSMMLFRPTALLRVRSLVEQVMASHRAHWRVARMFGLGFLLRCRLGWVSIAEAEKRVSRVSGLDCRGYVARRAEMAFDVDHLGDLRLARERLERLAGAG